MLGALGVPLSACLSKQTAAAGKEKTDSFEIWDNHCHLESLAGQSPAERMDRLMEFADRLRVDRVVVFMGWPWAQDPSPEQLRQQNDQVLEAIRGWPRRALAYCYVNPNHVEASLEEMHRCIENGPMVGIKLWVAKRCLDEAIDPIIHLATKLKAVVYQHTWLKSLGNLPGESTPMGLAKLAERHPQAMLLCGHAGGRWEQGIRAIRTHKNVFLETAGNDPTVGLVEMAVRELGAERVVFGSDAAGRSFASQLAKVQGAEISVEQQRLILGGNLRRLLMPILQSKEKTT